MTGQLTPRIRAHMKVTVPADKSAQQGAGHAAQAEDADRSGDDKAADGVRS